MAEIKLESVAKTFGSFAAVKGVNFTVDHGSFFVILGPSGCGKTTTLRMTAGLELPTSGRILLDGEDVTARPASARDIAFVFQLFALYPHMNVRQNIGFPLRCQNFPRAEIRQSVEETAKLLNGAAGASRAAITTSRGSRPGRSGRTRGAASQGRACTAAATWAGSGKAGASS